MGMDALNEAIRSAQENRKKGDLTVDKQEAMTRGLELMEKSKICMLGTNGDGGHPNIKAMLNLKHEGLRKVWFSTNTSSKRVKQLKKDNRACVYYVDDKEFRGLMTLGL